MLNQVKDVKTYLNTEVVDIQRNSDGFKAILSNNETIDAKAVILATGFDVFKAERKQEYGYGIYNNVMTSVELENFFRTGKDERINNPKKILAPRSKGKARAELRPARRQARLPHSRSLLLPGRER